MISVLQKEINSFFGNPIGYLIIGVFLCCNGLFLWVFKGSFNIFDLGIADLSNFFELAPWILLFLVPAITMKSFSEEIKLGTLEMLVTKPISTTQIVYGKFFGALLVALLAVVPTIVYIFTLSSLGMPAGNWDVGSTLGSYIGLCLLLFALTSIGVFTSSLTNNQIIAFITAVFIGFLFYFGFTGTDELINASFPISSLGFKAHYDSLARGVIDTRDVLYFLSIGLLFNLLSSISIQKR